MPVTTTFPEPKPVPEKAEWPLGTLKESTITFDEFANTNFVTGTPTIHTKKEVRKPLLIYTPDREKDAVIKIWRVMMRFMGDMIDYRQDYEKHSGHKSHQPEMGSVMTRLCKVVGSPQKDNPFGPQISQREPVIDIPMQTLPYKPRRGTFKRLKDTITHRIFGKGRGTVFHLLPLEETLRTQLERIQFIVGYGILRPRLRDEIYCGLCRQLRHNQYKDSVKKGWLLMNIIAGCFPPSQRCLDAILQFLDSGPKIHTASAKALLKRTLKNGDRLHPPSSLELEAVSEYKPLELQLHLTAKGESVSLPVDGASTAAEVTEAAYKQLGLTNSFGFHVFVTTSDRVTSLGCGQDHIMDALSQVEQISRDQSLSGGSTVWRLYLRKELFEPWEDFSEDHKATNLIYEQLKSGVLSHDYEFAQDEDLYQIIAQVMYVDKGASLDIVHLKENVIKPFIENKSNFEELTDKRVFDETNEHTNGISNVFDTLYGHVDIKPNSFNVKIDIISTAREYWQKQFARVYDANALVHGDVATTHDDMEGVCFVSVHSGGVSFLSSSHLVIHDIAYEEILQLAQQSAPDNTSPPSLVFTVLGQRVIECVTHDVDDVTDLVSYMLTGLNDRSIYAVAVNDHTARSTDDLDLEIGDLIVLDDCAGNTIASQKHVDDAMLEYSGCNERTGQHGRVNSELMHVLPALNKPSDKILELYKVHADSL